MQTHSTKCWQRKILEEEIPDGIVTASYEILPQFREYERTSTVAITAYIAPVMVRYIESLYRQLQERDFKGEIFITQSNGGVIPWMLSEKKWRAHCFRPCCRRHRRSVYVQTGWN